MYIIYVRLKCTHRYKNTEHAVVGIFSTFYTNVILRRERNSKSFRENFQRVGNNNIITMNNKPKLLT